MTRISPGPATTSENRSVFGGIPPQVVDEPGIADESDGDRSRVDPARDIEVETVLLCESPNLSPNVECKANGREGA